MFFRHASVLLFKQKQSLYHGSDQLLQWKPNIYVSSIYSLGHICEAGFLSVLMRRPTG